MRILNFFIIFLALQSQAYANRADYSLFTIELPNNYIAEESSLGSAEGIAFSLENSDGDKGATIIYDSMHSYSFDDIVEKYSKQFNAEEIVKNTEIDGEAYIMEFMQEDTKAVAYLFNEGKAYTLYVVLGEDSELNKAINSLEWK